MMSERGAFRKAVHAVCSLNKYGFNPIFVVKADEMEIRGLKAGFIDLGKNFKFETDDINFSFIPKIEKDLVCENNDKINESNLNLDCMYSRTLTKSGVYNCPALLNDYRGRSGASLKDFSSRCYLESNECQQCKIHAKRVFTNDWV